MNALLQTLVYLGIMGVGIVVGVLLRNREKLLKRIDVFTLLAVCVLVFLLGTSVGHSEEVRRNIGKVGLEALLIGVAAMAGSVALSYVVWAAWFRELDHEE